MNWIAPLLHFSDSALPVGAYAHSFGLEGMCQSGVVTDVESLRSFLLRDVSYSLRMIEIPLVARAHASQGVELQKLDQLSWALRPTRQLREAASKIGRQQRKLFQKTWTGDFPVLKHDQSPVVMGAALSLQSVPVEAAVWSVVYQTYSALLQASLKLIPIGPGATQDILHAAMTAIAPQLEEAMTLSEEDIGTFNPTWDIATSRHETAQARMFLS